MSARDEIFRALNALNIDYDLVVHERADTMEQLKGVSQTLGCVIPKNLFLTPRNKSAFYLCIVRPDYAFKTADISKQIGASRLSFAPEDQLDGLIQTHPGAISPMGLLFDAEYTVKLIMDERLLEEDRLAFHPNDNTQTLSMKTSDFVDVFLKHTGHGVTKIRVEGGEGITDED